MTCEQLWEHEGLGLKVKGLGLKVEVEEFIRTQSGLQHRKDAPAHQRGRGYVG